MNEYGNDFFDFIRENQNNDINKLRLKKYSDSLEYDVQFAITQIECRQKTLKKIPDILSNEYFLFPSTLLSEQCTNEIIAKFHGTLFDDCKTIIDLTAGLCVDSFYISCCGKKITAVEIDEHTASIDTYNMNKLQANVTVVCDDAVQFVKNTTNKYDAAFIDPARRSDNNKRLYGITDCKPDIIEMLTDISKICNYIIIKASPMLDIIDSINKIKNLSDVWIIGLKNECKELLFKVDFLNKPAHINIHTINFSSNTAIQQFDYVHNDNRIINTETPIIRQYLYEPNCCIMKSGAFASLIQKYNNLFKLHSNTHLFASNQLYPNFPGRIFVIEDILPFKDKLIKSINKEYPQINISTRNFKLSSEILKNRLKVKDGGDKYLFGTTFSDSSMNLIICSKAIF